jgi:hypothetical protein
VKVDTARVAVIDPQRSYLSTSSQRPLRSYFSHWYGRICVFFTLAVNRENRAKRQRELDAPNEVSQEGKHSVEGFNYKIEEARTNPIGLIVDAQGNIVREPEEIRLSLCQ